MLVSRPSPPIPLPYTKVMRNDSKSEDATQNAESSILPNTTVNPPPISRDEMQKDIQALQGELKKAEKWIIWLTAAMAFFAFCGVVVGGFQWAAIHGQLNVMEASERPYVGVLEVRTQPEPTGTQLILPILKNFGKNPAFKFTAKWVVYVDGKELEGKNANGPRTPFTFYPTANQGLGIHMAADKWSGIASGRNILTIRVSTRYRWPDNGKEYVDCEERQYDQSFNDFRILGECSI